MKRKYGLRWNIMLMNDGYKLLMYIISNKYTDSNAVDWNVVVVLNVWLKYARVQQKNSWHCSLGLKNCTI